jgi:hypothetical protein
MQVSTAFKCWVKPFSHDVSIKLLFLAEQLIPKSYAEKLRYCLSRRMATQTLWPNLLRDEERKDSKKRLVKWIQI